MNAPRLRIGLVGPLPPPSGGMANQTLQLRRLLQAEGAEVEVVQVNSPYHPSWVSSIKGVRAVFRLLPYLLLLWKTARRVDLLHVMANSGWSWHLFAAPAIWVGALVGKPVIVNYRGGEAGDFFRSSFAWVKPSLDRAATIVVPSGFLEKVFAQRGYATQIVPNIIDLSRFSAEQHRANGITTDAPRILVARNLEPIYDNATALHAFQKIRLTRPHAELVVAGSGPEKQMLESLAADLGVAEAVTFTGRVDNENMAALYYSADVMVNPSLADNMPISILEALACGVPVVTTDVGGIPHLVEHEKTALLIPAKDADAMAAAVLSLLEDQDKAARMVASGIESVRQYTWPNVRSRLLAVYGNVLAKDIKPLAECK